ncbi:MAG TPA: type II toxin-antitoxin system VapC family toxin [Candidatus Sulfotelmatobacter sp.]|jgi:PIN domain nuclease of toxin-antitoxin system|nr:type II toxin-antitoxin system VapC family toxin [Candidatus Sulfotelmatobacter sp.]
MRFLLDTHIWLWMFREPHKLSSVVHQAVTEPSNDRYLSPISIWEVMILLEKKRISFHEDFAVWFARTSQDLELEEANLTWQVVHEMRYILPNHKDPADRFLAATAIAHDLILVTSDQKLIGVPGLKVLANV